MCAVAQGKLSECRRGDVCFTPARGHFGARMKSLLKANYGRPRYASGPHNGMLIFYSQIVFAISLSRSEVLTSNYREYRKPLGSLLLRGCTSEQRRRPPHF